jgi:alanine racemase
MRESNVPGRPNRFEVDLAAIAHNAATVRRLVGPSCTVFAALKADAYGYGIAAVAPAVLAAGATGISLVSVADAVSLRQRGIEAPILLYPGVPITAASIPVIEEHSLMPTVLDLEAARLLSATARGTLRVFVKVDVGLERLGVHSAGAASFVRAVAQLPRLAVHGLYAHMHVRDNVPVAYLQWQFDRFTAVLEQLEAAGLEVPVRMTASTAVLQAVSTRMNLNAIDPGRVWFGLDKGGPGLEGLDLRPAFVALKTALVQVKPVQREAFGEYAPFPPRPGMRIGILPFGRFDGMVSLNCGHVLVRGARAPILATPSIEHTRVDLTDLPEAHPGDEVVVIGRQGDVEISPEDVAAHQNLPSPGMVALAIRDTVPRVYRGGSSG